MGQVLVPICPRDDDKRAKTRCQSASGEVYQTLLEPKYRMEFLQECQRPKRQRFALRNLAHEMWRADATKL